MAPLARPCSFCPDSCAPRAAPTPNTGRKTRASGRTSVASRRGPCSPDSHAGTAAGGGQSTIHGLCMAAAAICAAAAAGRGCRMVAHLERRRRQENRVAGRYCRPFQCSTACDSNLKNNEPDSARTRTPGSLKCFVIKCCITMPYSAGGLSSVIITFRECYAAKV